MADNQVLIQIRGDVADINAKLADLKGHIGTVRAEAEKLAGNAKLSFAILATGINQAIGVFQQIKAQVQQFTDAYAAAETATMKLAVAMRNQGDYSKEALEDLEEFAAGIQKTTAYEDDYVKARMATLKTYGMTNEEIKQAIPAILDLSTARRDEGMSADKAADLIGKAYIGNTERLKRYGIIVDESLTRAQKYEAAMKQLNERFGGAAAAELDTYSGQVQQLKNQMGDLAESIGKRLIQALRALQMALDVVAAGFWSMVEQILSGLSWLINRLEDFARWAGLNKVADGLATAGAKVQAGAVYASGKFQENIGLVVKHFDQMKKIGDIDSAVQKLKSGQRFISPPEVDKAAESAREAWARAARDIQAEIDKQGLDPLEKALIDLDKKVADLLEKAAKLPTAAEQAEAGGLIGRFKGVETDKAATEAAQKDFDELQKMDKAWDDLAKKRQAAKEAEINAQITSLDIAEKEGTYHRDTLNERIRLMRELLALQEKRLKDIDPKDSAALNAQIAIINQTKMKIAEVQAEQRPIFTELNKYAEEATDRWKQVGNALAGAFKKAEDALVDFVMTGKMEFGKLIDAIIADFIRLEIRAQITGPLAKMASGGEATGLFGFLGGLFGSGGEIDPELLEDALIAHRGGIVGSDRGSYRIVPSGLFATAPRYHGGLGSDEQATILQKGEGVFTPGQMRALGAAMGGDTNYNIFITANDAKSFEDMCRRNPGAIIGPVTQGLKDNRTRREWKGLLS